MATQSLKKRIANLSETEVVPADDADDARDQRHTGVDDCIQAMRDHVFSDVDDRRQRRWYNAATSQNPDEADHGDEAAANER